MYKKKISTIAVLTILTLSTLLAAIPMVSAQLGVPTVTPAFGVAVFTQVTVEGLGATQFGLVEVYWDTLATKIGEGYANSTNGYKITKIPIPEDIVGAHNVIVYDVLSSETNFATFTILSSIGLSTYSALPGDSVTVFANGFGEELDVGIGLGKRFANEVVETDEAVGTGDGAATDFDLDYAPVKPGSETIGAPGVNETLFETGDGTVALPTAITVTAPSNTANFTAGLYDEAGTTELVAPTDSTGDDATPDTVVLTYAYVATTNYTVRITFATETGDYTLADDGNPAGSGGPITIAEIGYTLNYATGELTFDTAPAAGVAINATYTHYTYDVTPAAGVETSELGSFMATFVVPAIAEVDYGDYTVIAIDADGNFAENMVWPPMWPPFKIDYYVTVTPSSGPTGITTTISGRIVANTDYELRFGSATIATGTSGATGTFTATYVIPAVLPTGAYTVSVVWAVTKTRTATFTVTPPPVLTKIQPASGVAGAVITISGENFTAGADISLYLGTTLVNSTADDDRFGPTGAQYTPAAGKFTDLEFVVPVIAPGIYVLKVIDENGASTGTAHTFTVLPTPVTTATLRGTVYYPCCTLSFNIFTTETDLGEITVTIKDPSGALWWTTNLWTLSGTITKSVYYQDQLINGNPIKLPLDAPLGSWNWTVTYTPTSTGVLTKASGLFTVAAEPGMQTVIDALDADTATILDAIAECCDDLTALLEALDAKIVAIDGTVATLDTSLGSIQTTVSSLGATITGLDGDIATIKTSVGGVTTSLASIDAVVGSMYGDVLTINTTLGIIEGTLMDMDGTIATIETDLGTVKLDVAAIGTDVEEALPVTVDMMPVWIAVILSLIAAIAAIFAVVTIRQKIAG